MSNFKRGKSRKQVRCTLCTPDRWKGNKTDRHRHATVRDTKAAEEAIKEETAPLSSSGKDTWFSAK